MTTQTLNKLLAALNECTEWGQVGGIVLVGPGWWRGCFAVSWYADGPLHGLMDDGTGLGRGEDGVL